VGRKLRVDREGAIHHSMCRGNNGEYIFNDKRCKEKYLELVCFYKEKYGIKLLAYCVVDNRCESYYIHNARTANKLVL